MWDELKHRVNEIESWSDYELRNYWIAALYERFSFNKSGKESYIAQLPPLLVDPYLTFLLWSQVGNGGLEQYFFNIGLELADDTIAALDRIGSIQSSRVFARVVAIQRTIESQTQKAREKASLQLEQDQQIEAWDAFATLYKADAFKSVEDFWKILDREHKTAWLNYVRRHAYLLNGS